MTRALLFDLDGTLVDTDPLHLAAFNALLAPRGRSLAMAEYAATIMGAPNSTIFAALFPEDDEAARAALADDKEARFRAALSAVEPRPGVVALLDWAQARGVAAAVVTNAPRANAEAVLDGLGLAARFATLVIGPELPRPKPDPMPYLEAMRRLGVGPGDSVAFEDSLSGLRAAAGSGALTFGVRGVLSDAALREAGAAAVIDDFTAPELWAALERAA